MNKVNYIAFLALSLGLLGACAQDAASGGAKTAAVTVRNTTTTSTAASRVCLDLAVGKTSTLSSRLEDLFQKTDVSNIEGDVTYCLEVSGTGTTADGWLRVEYEDDYGVSSLDTDRDGFQIIVGEYLKSSDKKSLNFIFGDNFGMVQVIATETAVDSKKFVGSIRFYNYPSYNDALNSQMNETIAKCQSGEWTVAKCLGYSPPSYWWNQANTTTTLADQAKTLLAGSSAKKLGDVTFTTSDIVKQ